MGSLALVVIFALCWAVAEAQQPKKVPRIGYLAAVSPAADAPRKEAFRQALRDFGYIEGQNIFIEYRHEDRNFDRLPELAAELVRLKIDVFVTVTTNAAQAARSVSKTIPHVFMGVTDPVTAGLVDSLPRPGGNSTGITNMAAILVRQTTGAAQGNHSQALPCCRAMGPARSRLRAAVARQSGAGTRARPAASFNAGKQRR